MKGEKVRKLLSLLTSHVRFAVRAPIVTRQTAFIVDTPLYTRHDRLRIENRNDGRMILPECNRRQVGRIGDTEGSLMMVSIAVSDIEDGHTSNVPTSVVFQ